MTAVPGRNVYFTSLTLNYGSVLDPNGDWESFAICDLFSPPSLAIAALLSLSKLHVFSCRWIKPGCTLGEFSPSVITGMNLSPSFASHARAHYVHPKCRHFIRIAEKRRKAILCGKKKSCFLQIKNAMKVFSSCIRLSSMQYSR